jgi:hypothetical protein
VRLQDVIDARDGLLVFFLPHSGFVQQWVAPDSKKRRSFLALLFAAGEPKR